MVKRRNIKKITKVVLRHKKGTELVSDGLTKGVGEGKTGCRKTPVRSSRLKKEKWTMGRGWRQEDNYCVPACKEECVSINGFVTMVHLDHKSCLTGLLELSWFTI